jgi:hypothetical protein
MLGVRGVKKKTKENGGRSKKIKTERSARAITPGK